jgi:hypothetical protein
MNNSVVKHLAVVQDVRERLALLGVFNPLADRYSTRALVNSTLVIKAGSSALAKTGAADSYFTVKGILVKIAASTDMPALAGGDIVTTNTVNVFCFFVDSAGALTSASGTPGVALANVVFPPFPQGKCLVGILIVTMAAAATFTAGTTALDAANTTTVFISPTGPFDPSVLLT